MNDEVDLTSLSKFLSYVLRHHPEDIGLELDENGWARISDLIEKAKRQGKLLTIEILENIVQHGSKKRFIISDDRKFIRAGYGHSVDVDLELNTSSPPDVLYHGTAKKNVPAILADGIQAGSRNFVHLSVTENEARSVGSRHGTPAILMVKAKQMYHHGYDFYQSDSEPDIWLTKKIPTKFVEKW